MRATLKTLLISALLFFAATASAAQMKAPAAQMEAPAAQMEKGLAAESGSHVPAETPDLAAHQGGMTLSQAVEQVRRQYNGRIVSAETEMNGKQEVHVIKVLTEDGKVKTVRVPGRRVN